VQRQHEFAVLLVEHDVEMVQSLVTRLYVLDFGTRIAGGPTDEVLSDAAVRKAYLGDIV
jgi:ABC-type branched-subunit amino acid transport system ATPase component